MRLKSPPHFVNLANVLHTLWDDFQIPHLFSGHLDIKDVHCAKKNYGRLVSYHIISRLGATRVQKGRFGNPINSSFFISSQTCRIHWN